MSDDVDVPVRRTRPSPSPRPGPASDDARNGAATSSDSTDGTTVQAPTATSNGAGSSRLGKWLRERKSTPPTNTVPPRHAAPLGRNGRTDNGAAPTTPDQKTETPDQKTETPDQKTETPDQTAAMTPVQTDTVTAPDRVADQPTERARPRPRPRPHGPAAGAAAAGAGAGAAAAAAKVTDSDTRTDTDTRNESDSDTDSAAPAQPVELTKAEPAEKVEPEQQAEPAEKADAAEKAETAEPEQQAEKKPKAKREKGESKGDGAGADRPERRVVVRRLVRLAIVLAVIAGAAITLRVYVVQPYYIPSQSMEPTLHGCPNCNDDHILINKLADTSGPPAEQDIIVFKRPPGVASTDSVLVKRVVGLPGDTVQLKKGLVYINGLAISEPYLNKACGAAPTKPLTRTTTWHIPADDVFVMGDNRCNSEDSRAFGPIPTSSIVGEVVAITWPIGRIGGVS